MVMLVPKGGWEAEGRKQRKAREDITSLFFRRLDLKRPMLIQIVRQYKAYSGALRANYSDEICISGDLFRYHLKALQKSSLLDELRAIDVYRENKPEDVRVRSDREMWHDLVRVLDWMRLGH